MLESGYSLNNKEKGVDPAVKGLYFVEHPTLGPCIGLSKEKSSGKFGLFGGKQDNGAGRKETIRREVPEELGKKIKVKKTKKIFSFETSRRLYTICTMELSGKVKLNNDEISGVGFYPLSEGSEYDEIRAYIEANLEEAPSRAIKDFINDHLEHTSIVHSDIFPKNSPRTKALLERFQSELGLAIA